MVFVSPTTNNIGPVHGGFHLGTASEKAHFKCTLPILAPLCPVTLPSLVCFGVTSLAYQEASNTLETVNRVNLVEQHQRENPTNPRNRSQQSTTVGVMQLGIALQFRLALFRPASRVGRRSSVETCRHVSGAAMSPRSPTRCRRNLARMAPCSTLRFYCQRILSFWRQESCSSEAIIRIRYA